MPRLKPPAATICASRPRLNSDELLDDVVAYLAVGRAVGERQRRALVHAAVGLVLLEDLNECYDHAYDWLLEEPLPIRLLSELGQLGGEAAMLEEPLPILGRTWRTALALFDKEARDAARAAGQSEGE